MITRFQRIPIQIAFAAISVLWGSCALADEIPDLGLLRQMVLRHEAQYANVAVESTTFHWDDVTNQQSPSSEVRRVVQWQDCFYESVYKNAYSGKIDPAAFRFVWCNGKTLTIYSPPDRVERFSGEFSPPERFQPYSVVLKSLGYNGTLSSFLKLGEKRSLDSFNVEITGTETEGEIRTLNVLGSRRLPGSRFSKNISLRLAIDHGYLPCRGENCTIEDGESQSKIVVEIPAFVSIENGPSLMLGIRVTRPEDPETDALASRDIVELRATFLTQKPADHVFEPTEFLGNPKILDHKNGEVVRERLYHPPVAKKIKPWLPIVNWLVINGVAMCGVALFYVFKMAKSTVHRQLLRSLK